MEDLSLFLFLLGAEDVGQYFESASVPTDAVVANRTMLAPHLYDDTPPPLKKVALSNWWQVWLPNACDGPVARLFSRPPLLKVVLGLRTTPSQDFGTNLNCVCMDFGFSSRTPFNGKMCVRPIPSLPSSPLNPAHHFPPSISPLLQNSISVEFNQFFSIRFLCVMFSLPRRKEKNSRPTQIRFLLFPKRTWTTTRNILRGCTVSCPATSPRWPVSLRIYMITSHSFSFFLPIFLFLPPFAISWNLYILSSRTEQLTWLNDFSLFTFSDIH